MPRANDTTATHLEPPAIGGFGDTGLRPDQRVELHPGTDTWMRGDRYGTIVVRFLWRGQRRYQVRMDRSGKTMVVVPGNLRPI